jgi:microcystin-dependent protein
MSFNSSNVEIALAKTQGQYSSSAAVGDAVFRTIGPRKLLIQTGTQEAAMCVDTSNNIGIGTTFPNYTLDVSGNVRITGNLIASGDFTINTVQPQVDQGVLHIDTTFNRVGINTTQPTSSLHVVGYLNRVTTVEGIQVGMDASGNAGIEMVADVSASSIIDFKHKGSSTSDFDARIVSYNAAKDLAFHAGTSEKVRFASSGHVGIGTSVPQSRLHVVGSTSDQGEKLAVFKNSSSSNRIAIVDESATGQLAAGIMNDGTGYGLGFYSWKSWDTTRSPFRFYQGSTNVQVMTIDESGNMGIGVSTPQATLDVRGNMYLNDGSVAAPALAFNSSTSTGLYLPGSSQLGLVTGGAERVRVTDVGRVGIGRTDPNAMLDVSGTVVALNGSAVAPAFSFRNDAASGIFLASTGALALATSGSEQARVDPGGNMGIGTTEPVAKLDVRGSVAANDGTAGAPAMTFNTDLDTGIYRSGNNSLSISTGAVERLRVDSNGRVGIALTDPKAALDVNGAIFASNGSASLPAFSFRSDVSSGMFLASNGELAFSTAGSEDVRIDVSGNVGIGTTDPQAKLDVRGVAFFNDGTATTPALSFNADTNTGMFRPGSDNLAISTGGNERMRVDAAGQVGIGVTNPEATLDVRGNVFTNDGSAATPALAFNADTNTGLFRPGSDTLGVATSGQERLRIDATGQVGIGTTQVKRKLHVAGDVQATAVGNNVYWDGAGYKFIGASGYAHNVDLNVTDGNMYFATSSATSTGADSAATMNTNFTLTRTGSLGIGTTDPQAKLDVRGQLYLNDGTAAAPAMSFNADADTGVYRIATNTLGLATNGTEGVRLDASGNVGIGHTQPQAKLHVGSGTGSSKVVTGWGADGNTAGTFSGAGLEISYTPAPSNYHMGLTRNNKNLQLHAWSQDGDEAITLVTQGTERLRVVSGGNVGIGRTDPQAVLDVSGGVLTLDGSTSAPALSFRDDQNTGLYRAGSDTLAVATGGLERLRVDASGNVGIGITNTTYKLDVSGGDVLFRNSLYMNSIIFIRFDGQTWPFAIGASGATLFMKNGSGAGGLSFNMTGNGINYTRNFDGGEAYRMDLAGNVVTQGSMNVNGTVVALANSATRPAYAFSTDVSSGMFLVSPNTLAFSTGSTERLRIDVSGNVGIGVTNPTRNLQVSSTFRVGNFNEVGNFDGAYLSLNSTYTTFWTKVNSGQPGFFIRGESLAPRRVQFMYQTPSSNNINEAMCILVSNGYVGIGKTSPDTILDVSGTATATLFSGSGASLTNLNSSNLVTGTLLVSYGGTGAQSLSSKSVLVGNGTGAVLQPTSLIWDDTNTSLGIGTASPKSMLHLVATQPVLSIQDTLDTNSHPVNRTYGTLQFKSSDATVASGNLSSIKCVTTSNNNVYPDTGLAFVVNAGATEQEAVRILHGGNVGIGKTDPGTALDVVGTVTATLFAGSGASLSGLNSTNVNTGTLAVSYGGTGMQSLTSGSVLVGNGANAVLQPTALTWDNANSVLTATTYSGSGSSLTNLNTSNVNTGTLLVNYGGTGAQSLASNKLLVGNATEAVLQPANLHWDTTNSRLGIGTDAPTETLHVVGTARTTTGLITGVKRVFDGNGNLTANSIISDVGALIVDASNNVKITSGLIYADASNNRVGVGTTQPGYKLDVAGDTRIQGNLIINGTTTIVDTNTQTTEQLVITNDGTGPALVINQIGPATVAEFQDDGVPVLRIADGGNVGIGTTQPTTKLDVSGSATVGWNNALHSLTVNGDAAVTANKPTVAMRVAQQGSGNILDVQKGSTVYLTVINSGNVGIAKTNPNTALDVNGTTTSTLFAGSGASLSGLNSSNVNTGTLLVSYGGIGRQTLSAGSLVVGNGTGAVITPNALVWDVSNSRLGINKTDPSTALDVSGTITATLFAGSGASIAGLNSSNVNTGTLAVSYGGTGANTLTSGSVLVGNGNGAVLQPTALTWNDTNGRLAATVFAGSGAQLTGLNSSNVNVGTLLVNYGGTGAQSLVANQLLIGNGTNPVFQSAALSWNNATGTLSATVFSGSGSDLTGLNTSNASTGTLLVNYGGTGVQTLSSGKLLVGNGTGAVLQPTALSWDNATQVLSAPTFSGSGNPLTGLNTSNVNTGTLLVEYGGTGMQSLTSGAVLVGNGTGAVLQPSALTWNNGTGTLTATTYVGSGSGLNNLNSSNVNTGTLLVSYGGTGAQTLNSGSVLVGNGQGAVLQPSSLNWDNINGRLGVGKTGPTTAIDVSGTITANVFAGSASSLNNLNTSNVNTGTLSVSYGGTGAQTLSANKLLVGNGTGAVLQPSSLHWDGTNSRLGVGTAVPSYALEVSNTTRVAQLLIKDSSDNASSRFLSALDTNQVNGTSRGITFGKLSSAKNQAELEYWHQQDASDNNRFKLGFHSVEVMSLLAGGNVGIGKTNPGSKLDVVGTVTATLFAGSGASLGGLNSSNVNTGTLLVDYGGTGVQSLTSNKVLVGNGTGAVLQPTSLHWDDGNTRLGIGRTQPSQALHAGGSGLFDTDGGFVSLDSNGGSRLGLLKLSGLDPVVAMGNATAMAFGVGNNANLSGATGFTEHMRLTTTGRLGIGKATPSSALDVSGTITANTFSGSGSSLSNLNTSNVNTGTLLVSYGGTGVQSLNAGSVVIGNGTDAVLTPSNFVWDNINGRVGIGKTNPGSALDVSGVITANTFSGSASSLTNLNTSNANTGTLLVNYGGTGAQTLSANKLLVGNGTGALIQPNSLHWDSDNTRLGIGTISPESLFHLSGGTPTIDNNNTVFEKYFQVQTNNVIQIIIPFTKPTYYVNVMARIRASAIAANISGTNIIDYVSTGRFYNASTSFTTQFKQCTSNVPTSIYADVSANISQGTLYIYIDGRNGFTQMPSWSIHLVLLSSNGVVFKNGTINTLTTTITDDAFASGMTYTYCGNVGIGLTNPSTQLDVSGTVTATLFSGSGASISGLNSSNVITGTLSVSYGGTGAQSLTSGAVLVGNGTGAVLQPSALTWNNATGTLNATTYVGSGSGLTNLNSSNVNTGTLLVSYGGTGAQSLTSGAVLVGNGTGAVLQPSALTWDNSTGTLSATTFVGSGSGLANLNTSNVNTGTLLVNYGGTGANVLTSGSVLVGNGAGAVLQPSALTWNNSTGTLTATTFVGSGSGLNNLNTSNVNTGTLLVDYGGSGRNDISANKLMVGNGTGAILTPANLHWDSANSRLGINTSSPARELDVSGNINFAGKIYQNGIEYFASQWVATGTPEALYYPNTVSVGKSTRPTSGTTLDVSGNVLMGRLLIKDSSDNATGRLISALDNSLSNGSNVSFALGKSNTNKNQGELTYYHVADASNNNRLGIGLRGLEAMSLTADGRVGIGVTNPNRTLQVAGSGVIAGTLDVSSNVTVNGTQVVLDATGKVGVGLVPAYPIDVSGDVNVTGNYLVNGSRMIDPVPVGSVMPFSGATLPQYCAWCDGSAVSRTRYPELFALIGTTYGAGDGTFTFNLPDLRGRAPIGAGQGTGLTNRVLGATGGAETHTLITSEIPGHSHSMFTSTSTAGLEFQDTGDKSMVIGDRAGSYDQVNTDGVDWVQNTGGGAAHNNMQPFLVCRYVIKLESPMGVTAVPYNHWSRDLSFNLTYTNGNVGLGTTVPGTTLDVQGSVNLTSTLYKNGVAFGTFGAVRRVFRASAGQSVFDISVNNIVTATHTDAEVYLNGTKLVYVDASNNDFTLTTIKDMSNNYTILRVTLAIGVALNATVDVTVWPSNVTTSSAIRYDEVVYQKSEVGTVGPSLMVHWGYADLSGDQVFNLNQEPGNPAESMFNGTNFLFQDKTGENGQWNYARYLFRATTITGVSGDTVRLQVQSKINSVWNDVGVPFDISVNDPTGAKGYNTYSSPWFSHVDIGTNSPTLGLKVVSVFQASNNSTDTAARFRLGQVWLQFKAN